jgi:hypothetical protein
MSCTPAVPPPPVAGAPKGTGLGDGLAEALGDAITTGAAVVGVADGEADADADGDADGLAEGLELGATAVKKLPLGVAEAPADADVPVGEHAVVAASTVSAPQPIAASLARPPMAGAP